MIYLITQDLTLVSENSTLNIISLTLLLAKMLLHFLVRLSIVIHSSRNQTNRHSEDSYAVMQKTLGL